MASTVVVFATSVSCFFSRLLILSVKLFFFSLTNEVVVVDEAAEAAEVNELERKEVDIVKVLRIGLELKVVRDLEPVITLALCSSTVVVSTLEASLMKVTLSFEDVLLSITASDGLRSGSSGSLGT